VIIGVIPDAANVKELLLPPTKLIHQLLIRMQQMEMIVYEAAMTKVMSTAVTITTAITMQSRVGLLRHMLAFHSGWDITHFGDMGIPHGIRLGILLIMTLTGIGITSRDFLAMAVLPRSIRFIILFITDMDMVHSADITADIFIMGISLMKIILPEEASAPVVSMVAREEAAL